MNMTTSQLIEHARSLRNSGQVVEALKIYNQIVKSEPNNVEALFGIALAFSDTHPKKSYSIFKKILSINPNILPAYENLAVLANNLGEYKEAISIMNKAILLYPENLDLIYHKATLIGNSGDYLSALLEYYFVMDNSNLKTDSEAFINHQISSDIALCKINLRNATVNIDDDELINDLEPSSRQLKEFHYPIPAKLFGEENYYFDFGQMNGYSIKEVLETKPNYIVWAIGEIDYFCVSEEIIEILKRKGTDIKDLKKLNSTKLVRLEMQKNRLEFDGEAPDTF